MEPPKLAHESLKILSSLLLLLLLASFSWLSNGQENTKQQRKLLTLEKDFRWPNRQLNIMVDTRSLNETERQILAAAFDQIEHKTCIKVKRLSPETVNPFDNRLRLPEQERNFVYIFKAQFGLGRSEHPPLGLSSFGCVNQGRQSMVLGDLAFRWPDLVLRYHILRSLAVPNLTRPDSVVRQRLNVLPLSQKIEGSSRARSQNSDSGLDPAPALFAYATFAGLANKNNATRQVVPVEYLSEQDLVGIKQLYNCSDYENRLSMKPLNEFMKHPKAEEANFYSSMNVVATTTTTTTTMTLPDDSTHETTATTNHTPHHGAPVSGLIDYVTDRMGPAKINDTIIDDAAKSIIMNQLLADEPEPNAGSQDNPTTSTSSRIDAEKASGNESSTTVSSLPLGQCKPLESCPIDSMGQLPDAIDARTPSTDPANNLVPAPDPSGGSQEEMRPMMLKLDEFHAQDPQLLQANQMKLSQLNNNASIETYRLMNAADLTPNMQQQQQFQLPSQLTTPASSSKSEMLISFEQSSLPPGQTNDPVATLASSQVLKLCSCTCQTMAPVHPNPNPQPLPTPTIKPKPPTTTACPTTHDPWPPMPSTNNQPLPTTLPRSDEPVVTTTPLPPPPPIQTTTTIKTKTTTEKTTLQPTTPEPTTTDLPPLTEPTRNATSSSSSGGETTTPETTMPSSPGIPTTTQQSGGGGGGGGSMTDNPCEQVQWVKPNKTVYASAKIVWDVDRANQNYFLCNNQINDELIPGKTHGFSCKVGNEGRAYEMHNFQVLTKPESVNLAWIQRTSGSLGKTNLPVIGGFSKNQDPLVVSRCLVRDENNDIITLIGYINSLGVGLFPFDDIQIECSQYDVLACVS